MRQEKIVFIIPGFGHKPTNKGYRQLAKLLRMAGYYPIPVKIPWQGSTISENTAHFLKQYEKKLEKFGKSKKDIYFLGFSYGAMIAFIASTKISVKGLILCSLSPFFKEDLPKKLSQNATMLEEKRYKSFSAFRSRVLAKKIKARKIMMIYGDKESPKLIRRSTNAFTYLPQAKKYLFSIKKTEHNISDKKYISAISLVTKTFL